MRSSVDDKLEWYHTWCEPVVVALICKDQLAAEEKLEAAQCALKSEGLEPTIQAKLRYQLAFIGYQVGSVSGDENRLLSEICNCEHVLGRPGIDSLAEGLRLRLYIQFRIRLDSRNIQQFDERELCVLLEQLSANEKILELYSCITYWAFNHKSIAMLEEAVEFAVAQGKAFNAQWIWHRARVMLSILKETVTKREVLALVQSATLPNHISILRNLIWPAIRDCGLLDEELEKVLTRNEQHITLKAAGQIESEIKPFLSQPDPSRGKATLGSYSPAQW